MALYRVIVPFAEASQPAGPARCTTLEVEADSEPEARRIALGEFEEMSRLSDPRERPRVIEKDIKIERAPVAKRAGLEVSASDLSPGVACVRLVGSLSSVNFGRFQDCLDALKAKSVSRLVLDLSGLTYVNSTGLSLFVAAGDLFDMRLAAVPARISRLLKMIGLDRLYPTFPTATEAAKAPASEARGEAGESPS